MALIFAIFICDNLFRLKNTHEDHKVETRRDDVEQDQNLENRTISSRYESYEESTEWADNVCVPCLKREYTSRPAHLGVIVGGVVTVGLFTVSSGLYAASSGMPEDRKVGLITNALYVVGGAAISGLATCGLFACNTKPKETTTIEETGRLTFDRN